MSTRENNGFRIENNRFKKKCKWIKRFIKDNVIQNAAICDEISQTQEKLLIVREECKFLTKKLNVFEHKFEKPVVEPKVLTNNVINKPASKKKVHFSDILVVEPKKVHTNNILKKPAPKKKVNVNGVSKNKSVASKRKKSLVEIEQPVVSGNVTIINFGQIVYDTPFYYSDYAIYSGGYYATRMYAHFRNIFSKCTYHCRVIRAGSTPRFEIMDDDKLFKVTGLSTDECHSHLLSLINKILGHDDFIASNRNGDRFFGLSLPVVRLKLQAKPESKYCTGYIRLKSQYENYKNELKAESDPSVSFEGLHACLKKFRSRR